MYCSACCRHRQNKKFTGIERKKSDYVRLCKLCFVKPYVWRNQISKTGFSQPLYVEMFPTDGDYADYLEFGKGWYRAKMFAAECYDEQYAEEDYYDSRDCGYDYGSDI